MTYQIGQISTHGGWDRWHCLEKCSKYGDYRPIRLHPPESMVNVWTGKSLTRGCSPYEISYRGHFPHGRAAADFSSLPSTGTDEK
jgi:hypothetical protein